MASNERGRYWTFIVFKDNYEKNPNWIQDLIDTHIRFCISPLHDKDKWSENDIAKHQDRAEYIKEHLGEPKTPHYHVMLHFDDNTTLNVVKNISESLNLPLPKKVIAPLGMYHYFTHEFNSDKAQYDPNDIRHFNGSDPSDYLLELSAQEKMDIMQYLATEFVQNKFTKFYDMLCFAAKLPNPTFLHVTQTNMYFFKQILVDNINYKKEKDNADLNNKLPKGRHYDGK